MILYLLIYFLVGIGQDILFTLNIRFVALKRVLPAVVTSFLTVVASMGVLYNILAKLDEQRGILGIIFYASGVAVGTFIAMKLNLEKSGKN